MPKVLNKYRDTPNDQAVYIGRPSPWGNPYWVGRDGTREEVIIKYKHWISRQPELIERARLELRGKDLVCFCKPHACHGDILLEIVNAELDNA